MSRLRYPELAEALAEACRNGVFRETLPPVRELCSLYRVSRNTVTLAMRRLARYGALEPTPGGTRIVVCNMPPPPRRLICVVGKMPLETLRAEGLYHWLETRLAALGYRAMVSNDPVSMLDAVDGFIFLYSSLPPEFNRTLQARGIPFVVANSCPDSYGISWSDWDHASEFNDIIGELVRQGARRIAIHMLPTLNYTNVLEDFIQVKHEYQLFHHSLDDFMRRNSTGSKDFVQKLAQLDPLPDTLIGLEQQIPELRAALREFLPERPMRLVRLQFRTSPERRNRQVAERLCRLLQRVLADPWCQPRHYRLKLAFRATVVDWANRANERRGCW